MASFPSEIEGDQMIKTKRCWKCGETKQLTEFYRTSDKCKACHRAYRTSGETVARRKVFNAEHSEEIRAYDREYRLRRDYGISLVEYDEMLEAQGGGCAICGKTPEENRRRLAVDHDHETGEVRGLLCIRCNHGLGNFLDSSELLRSAIQYLQYVQLRKESMR